MDTLVHILFAVLSLAAGALLGINVTLVALRLAHRKVEARRLSTIAAPYVSYFRIGGKGFSDVDRSKHA